MNICMQRELMKPDFKLVQMLKEDIEMGCEYSADWFDGLIVSIKHLDVVIAKKKFNKVIWVLTNDVNTPNGIEDDELESVMNKIKDADMRVNFVGLKVDEDDNGDYVPIEGDGETEDELRAMEQVCRIANASHGVIMEFPWAFDKLREEGYKRTKSNPIFKGKLDIGNDFALPVQMLSRVKETLKPSYKQSSVYKPEPTSNGTLKLELDSGDMPMASSLNEVKRTTEYTDVDGKKIDKTRLQTSYRYGAETVHVPDYSDPLIQYKTEQSMKLICFTPKNNIPPSLLMGDTYELQPPQGDVDAYRALTAMIRGTEQAGKVGIVRTVMKDNKDVALGVLRPHVRETYATFLYNRLPFADDMRQFNLPSLQNTKTPPTRDQAETIDNLIDSMDLMEADRDLDGDPREAYQSKNTLNPALQYYHSVVFETKADNLARMAPLESFLEPVSRKIDDRSADERVGRLIADNFELKAAEKSKSRVRSSFNAFKKTPIDAAEEDALENGPDIPMGADTESSILRIAGDRVTQVGTISPVSDFKMMMTQTEDLKLRDAALVQIKEVIQDLVARSMGEEHLVVPLDCVRTLRETCVKNVDAASFNDWIKEYKDEIDDPQSHGYSFWHLLVENRLSLITQDETNNTADPSAIEADKFLGAKTVKEVAPAEQDSDLDDMMDDFE
ncbi:hypothetical protein SARC_08189 [Sphaeroforma arctica JP610]|uniref:Ku domain-containing protein n=1 Tax=Sphaeroforma arctica JP610 TaxID=667725 RepID=A0A0L0FRU7_9EUKA|nr:hypothetical protein SARC_08189 [Sphaeroforma arctica JP610]KNC79414.1 hypothetical protein SARC_08189 [Sphaeroforma arctica JP610]|eukprot:XP_014153316.1 hypothetical protein SARC_08189 [Sphaeroforma arctica JP610]